MRKIQMVLIGTFLFGVLLSGIGTGVALAEYSSLQYDGEKILGEEHMVTKVLEFQMPDDGQTVIVGENQRRDLNRVTELVEDSEVPVGVLQYEITYNEALVEPFLQFEEYAQAIIEETEPAEESELQNRTEAVEESTAEDETEAKEEPEREPVYAGELEVALDYQGDGFQLLLEDKDMILNELKQKRISSYRTLYVTKIIIKVNPETRTYVKMDFRYNE